VVPSATGELGEASARDVPAFPTVRPLATYTYNPTTLYAVTTAPERVTDLALQPGERLTVQPTAGDAARWVISVADPVVGEEPAQHVFLQPLRPGIVTNLTLTTNRRSYHLELSSATDGRYTAAVAWKYPLDDAERHRQEVARLEAERQSATAVAELDALRFDYRIEATSGSPSWKPTAVFDDGQKTFIRFREPVSPTRAPLLFVLRAGEVKTATYVNYRIKGDLYVLDRVITAAELRLSEDGDPSSKHQDIVRITRR
jgi:type IV secretion system protein VirB9